VYLFCCLLDYRRSFERKHLYFAQEIDLSSIDMILFFSFNTVAAAADPIRVDGLVCSAAHDDRQLIAIKKGSNCACVLCVRANNNNNNNTRKVKGTSVLLDGQLALFLLLLLSICCRHSRCSCSHIIAVSRRRRSCFSGVLRRYRWVADAYGRPTCLIRCRQQLLLTLFYCVVGAAATTDGQTIFEGPGGTRRDFGYNTSPGSVEQGNRSLGMSKNQPEMVLWHRTVSNVP